LVLEVVDFDLEEAVLVGVGYLSAEFQQKLLENGVVHAKEKIAQFSFTLPTLEFDSRYSFIFGELGALSHFFSEYRMLFLASQKQLTFISKIIRKLNLNELVIKLVEFPDRINFQTIIVYVHL
jgi:hypothetical protein